MSRLQLTQEQFSIISDARQGGNMVIRAFAGSGKTLTLAGTALTSKVRGAYLVYNAAMRRDAQKHMPHHVPAVTGHSMAYQNIVLPSPAYHDKFRMARDGRQIPFRAITKVADCKGIPPLSERQAASLVLETVKQFQFSASIALERHHVPMEKMPAKVRAQLNETDREWVREGITDQARKLWQAMADEDRDTPILHDTYLKLLQLRSPQINIRRWLCDEWQDTNPVVDDIIRSQEDAQKIYVGDPYQAIYGWRAAHDALSEHRNTDGFQNYTLSKSFRFGPQVASMATGLLRARGEQTEVRGAGPDAKVVNLDEPYTVIARNNLTLLDHVTRAAEKNQKIAMGVSAGEMASMVRSAYNLYCNEPEKVKHSELKGYQSWQEFRDVTRVLDDGVLKGVVRMMETYKSEALDLAKTILENQNTSTDDADVILTTAHRAKGKEWEQVVLADDLHPSKTICQKLLDRTPLTDRESESVNLLYVALTRTKSALSIPNKTTELLNHLNLTASQVNAPVIDYHGNQLASELADALGENDNGYGRDSVGPHIG